MPDVLLTSKGKPISTNPLENIGGFSLRDTETLAQAAGRDIGDRAALQFNDPTKIQELIDKLQSEVDDDTQHQPGHSFVKIQAKGAVAAEVAQLQAMLRGEKFNSNAFQYRALGWFAVFQAGSNEAIEFKKAEIAELKFVQAQIVANLDKDNQAVLGSLSGIQADTHARPTNDPDGSGFTLG